VATDYIKTVQTRLTRKGTRLSKSQIREVYNQVVTATVEPTEDELRVVIERLEAQFKTPESNQIVISETAPTQQQQEIEPMTPAQPTAQPSNSALATSNPSTLSQAPSDSLGVTQNQIQEAVEQQFGRENIETKTAILNYVAQDTFSTAQELQTALSKLRQMRLDILMKLINDHNSQSSSDEELLKNALLTATANRQKETEVFFGSFENQLLQMRATFGV
jgi:6-phosphofructokinase